MAVCFLDLFCTCCFLIPSPAAFHPVRNVPLPSYWICSLACPPFYHTALLRVYFILSSPVPSSASLPLASQMTVDSGPFPIPYCCVRATS
uniref:Secreted protein n=1 Tax=Aegilops tauschii subsp. strangulata TaxID=200361 RepID=A0A453MZX0_AEGTS